jgi:hypothetical protein
VRLKVLLRATSLRSFVNEKDPQVITLEAFWVDKCQPIDSHLTPEVDTSALRLRRVASLTACFVTLKTQLVADAKHDLVEWSWAELEAVPMLAHHSSLRFL